MLGVTYKPSRAWTAPLVTAVLLAITWTVPLWADPPARSGITVTAEPQLRGAGDDPATAREAGFGLEVQVDGAGAGQQVVLEMRIDGEWVVQDEGRTDAEGRVHLVASEGVYGRVVTDVDGSERTQVFDAVSAGPTLYWNEEFNEDSLGAQWLAIPQPGDGETCTMTGDRGTSVEDGQLVLTVEEDPDRTCRGGTRPLLVNGHQVLRVVIGYGTTAARIKLPAGRAVKGQFWLQPGDPGQRWVMDGKHEGVVIAETEGTGRDARVGTSVNQVEEGDVVAAPRLVSRALAPDDGRFHVYSVTYTPAGFTFAIDGEVVREVEASSPYPPLTIGLSVLPMQERLPPGRERRAMYVDWLRVWVP